MKFELTDQNQDHVSSPSLRVIAESQNEVLEVFKHFRLDDGTEGVLALADALRVGSFTYETKPSEKRSWFDVDVYLDRALQPYCKLLEYATGWKGGALEIEDMELTANCPNRLGHTHVTDMVETVGGMFHAHVYIQAQEWNKMDAATNAQRNADDYVQACIGKRKHEPEYRHNGNGQYTPNPDWARKRHMAEPGIGAEWLWASLFAWWRKNHATEAQRRVLDAVDALEGSARYGHAYHVRQGGGDEAHLIGSSLYALDPTGTCNYDGKGKMARVYSWEEFRALGVEVSA